MDQKKIVTSGILIFFGLIILLTFSNNMFHTIEAGQQGVLFKKFGDGLDKDNIYGQGFHVIAPWNTLFVYDVRLKEHFEQMQVLSKNGLTIKVDLSCRYRPEGSRIGYLHETVGEGYLEGIIVPEIRSATREVIGKYLPEELYSSKREAIQDEIFQRTSESISKKDIFLDAILIREVVLPQSLQEAIERKLKEEQESLEYEYKLVKERKEAERKIIEAQAKADANQILNASLTDKILKDKGIEATLELAQSPNSKVIVVGGEGGGLPLILGGQ